MEIKSEDVLLVNLFNESEKEIPNYKKVIQEIDYIESDEIGKTLNNLKNSGFIDIQMAGDRVPFIETIQITPKGLKKAKEIFDTIAK